MDKEVKDARIEIRISEDKKKALEVIAAKRGGTISSLLGGFIQSVLDSEKLNSCDERNNQQVSIYMTKEEKDAVLEKARLLNLPIGAIVRSLFEAWLKNRGRAVYDETICAPSGKSFTGNGRTVLVSAYISIRLKTSIKSVIDPMHIPLSYLGYTLLMLWANGEITLE